jgi:hypothetical protein
MSRAAKLLQSLEQQQLSAISSVAERLLHTQEVAGSNPASRIFCKAALFQGRLKGTLIVLGVCQSRVRQTDLKKRHG